MVPPAAAISTSRSRYRSTRLSSPVVTRTVLGHEVRRVEDPGLVTGAARFVGDLDREGMLHAVFVRSTVAHGQLRAVDRVRFAGEPVAVVVARSPSAATDAAEAVVVAVVPLPVVLDPLEAARDGAPLLFPEHGTNIAGGRHHDGDDDLFAGDDIVVTAELRHQRIAPVPLEPNGVLAVPEADGSLTLWASTQSVFGVRDEVCAALGLPPERLRVRAPSVGGGFGAKGGTYVEQI